MTGYQGFAQLGEMLGGGGQPDGTAYAQGLQAGGRAREAGYSADKAFEEARIARMMAEARSSFPQVFEGQGYTPLESALMQASQSPNMRNLGLRERANFVPDTALAAEALAAGNLPGYNAFTASALGEQIEPYSAVGGGNAVMRADTGEIALTPMGMADAAADSALAGSRANTGKAALIRAERGPAPKAAPKGAPAGAKRAKDGKLYAPDPARPGKYLLVEE